MERNTYTGQAQGKAERPEKQSEQTGLAEYTVKRDITSRRKCRQQAVQEEREGDERRKGQEALDEEQKGQTEEEGRKGFSER